jgi:hypothetical protein
MSRLILVLGLVLGIAILGFVAVRQFGPSSSANVPDIATSVDYIRQIGDLAVLRASIKEIVTTKVGNAGWFTTQGKLAIICHFDIKYTYDLRKARISAGTRSDGVRYCVIHLPKHQYEVSTQSIRFYDEQDGSWLGFAQRTPPDERTKALDAARVQAETQAKAFLTDMQGEIQNSARATLGQLARALGFADVSFEFED